MNPEPSTPSQSTHQVSIRLGKGTLALLTVLMLVSAVLGGFIVSRFSPTGTTTLTAAPAPVTLPADSPPTSVPVDRKATADQPPSTTAATTTVPAEPDPPGDSSTVQSDDGGTDDSGTIDSEPDDGETIDSGPDDGLFGQDPSVAATYPVSGRTLGGDPIPRHLQAWNRITELVPDRYLNLLTGLEILEGDGDAAAYVYPDDNDPTRWVMGIDVSGMDDAEEFTHTIVHELGHLVTLNSDQVPPVPVNSRYDAVAEACRTYFTGEGCALDGSYMGLFAERFWNDILDEWLALDEITDEDAYWEAADRFWSRHADRFISDYAATNPGEDMAETFAWFVLNDRPAGDTVAEQKVLNMWDQPELVSLREQIRSGL